METLNFGYVEEQYRLWKKSPDSLSSDWQHFFRGFELGNKVQIKDIPEGKDHVTLQSRVDEMIRCYRDTGHLLACMDPLSECSLDHPLLGLGAFKLTQDDMDRKASAPFSAKKMLSIREILERLKKTYCGSIGVEYTQIQDHEERSWIEENMESTGNDPVFHQQARKNILLSLIRSTQFETFLNKSYVGVTRFSLEGADAVIPALDSLMITNAGIGCEEIILGMAHRGRLNVLAHILKKPYREIFAEFESCYDPDSLVGSGDVKYHTGYLTDIIVEDRFPMRIYLVHNPSHLESVNPVVEGIVRSRQDMLGNDSVKKVMPVLIHGDAAFAGQGIVTETLNLSRLKGYETGGTFHIVINNQIGYTTLPEDSRSTRYATDIAKMLMVPVFHVHGEDPEALVHVIRIASEYRAKFRKDVVVDLVCYRKYGHNEGDDPYFTQPLMYDRIRQKMPLSKLYGKRLVDEKVVTLLDIEQMEKSVQKKIDDDFKKVHGFECAFPNVKFYEVWKDYNGLYERSNASTGIKQDRLIKLCKSLTALPEGFNAHAKIIALLQKRMDSVEKGENIDWANAEALAFASLLTEKIPIRLSGQDVRRGTFSQRHAFIADIKTGKQHIPLNNLEEGQAFFAAYDSALAEAGVLGFEYGYSLVQPNCLTIWEAQFGDFINNAQPVIDLYIASSETKWQKLSGLVLLLPHGLEGLGPEHSSARPERFLQLCADDNMQICNPTTPSQYFHLLRRQIRRSLRKPLVVLTPKSLLRNPLATSSSEELINGRFLEVLDEPAKKGDIRKVIFCSGKIYYELVQKRQSMKKEGTAIVRLEQYYPFPEEDIKNVVLKYAKAKTWLWVQEEPENMGAWCFVGRRLEDIVGKSVIYVGRKPSASPATGFPKIYKKDQAEIMEKAIKE